MRGTNCSWSELVRFWKMSETEAARMSEETQRGRRRSGESEVRVWCRQLSLREEEIKSPVTTELRLRVTFKGTRPEQRSLL